MTRSISSQPDANIRLDPKLDSDLLASIKSHGVLVPVLAVRIPTETSGPARAQADERLPRLASVSGGSVRVRDLGRGGLAAADEAIAACTAGAAEKMMADCSP